MDSSILNQDGSLRSAKEIEQILFFESLQKNPELVDRLVDRLGDCPYQGNCNIRA
jgi:hypothetical protein